MTRYRELELKALIAKAPPIASSCCGGKRRPTKSAPPGVVVSVARADDRTLANAALSTALAVADGSGPRGSSRWRVALRAAVGALNAAARDDAARIRAEALPDAVLHRPETAPPIEETRSAELRVPTRLRVGGGE